MEHAGQELDGVDPADAYDADSDLEELQVDIARFDESVMEFLASHRGNDDASREPRVVARVRGARGPRKAAKPRGDITARLSKVNQAFLSGDYNQALDLAFEIIRINAETHQAWTALASIFRERGELDRALSAMVYAAHLRPKDVPGWLRCASFALESLPNDDSLNLKTARLCFSAALRADRTNLEARIGKAGVCHRQGHLLAAVAEFNYVLRSHPHDLEVIRRLAETCIDSRNTATAIPSAISAYKRYFDHAIRSNPEKESCTLWHDIGVYMELIAVVGKYGEAIFELKRLSRWLLGRFSEVFWDECQGDDREWDVTNDRRILVTSFIEHDSNPELFGLGLPLDLRIRLALYRLKRGDIEEALNHLSHLDPTNASTEPLVEEHPFLTFDLGVELRHRGLSDLARNYFELLRSLPGDPDAAILLQLGRCYLDSGAQETAEEYFLAALDVDEENIDARIELANLYEKAREDEEALILAAEALALQGAREHPLEDLSRTDAGRVHAASDRIQNRLRRRTHRDALATMATSDPGEGRPALPKRYRPKRLAGPDKRRQDEQARAVRLSRQYEIVRDLKRQVLTGDEEAVSRWMAASKELIDDFRSLKRFYTWDKYLHFLGPQDPMQDRSAIPSDTELSQMYARLSRTIAPQSEQHGSQADNSGLATHRGITFDSWLNLFLDYAIGLAVKFRRQEAYQVCAAAEASTVFQSPRHNFYIYVAWSVCAIYTIDEERCVAVARHLMREGRISDSCRMFALVSFLCQSSISWYTSGPAQKYILRQIKAIDSSHQTAIRQREGNRTNETMNTSTIGLDIDVCLLMLYGHILFTSTSYSYALGYFLRARSLDPTNAMVNLSLGLAYVHSGLKRQSTNRQYLILQGQAFLSQYVRQRPNNEPWTMAERYYNMGRLFQLLGIHHLSSAYYEQALDLCKEMPGVDDLSSLILANTAISLLNVGNLDMAFSVVKENLRL